MIVGTATIEEGFKIRSILKIIKEVDNISVLLNNLSNNQMSSASISFLSHLEFFFNTNSASIEHFNHLNILINAYLSPLQPPAPETIQALESLHSKRSEYLKTITRAVDHLEEDLERRGEEVDPENSYFNDFLTTKISAKNRDKVRQLLIYPLILTIAFSYPPPVMRPDKAPEAPVPKEGKDSEAKTGGTGQHSTNPIGPSNVSTGTVSKKYKESNYEILPYSLNASASEEERERRDLDIFKNLLNRYVIMVDDIVSYLPEADDNSISATRKEVALCKNVHNKIVEPVLKKLLNPCFSPLFSKDESDEAKIFEETIQTDVNRSYFPILKFWCKVLLIDLDPEASVGYDERMKQILKSRSKSAVLDVHYTTGGLSGGFGLKPDGKLVSSVIGLTEVFNSPPLEGVATKTEAVLGYKGLLRMQITVYPVEVKKEIFNTSKPGFGVQLANEKIDGDVTLDLKKGWTTLDMAEHDNFLKIQQQGLRYLAGSSEVLFNHVIYVFLHHGIMHFAHVEIDLESLEFRDDPKNPNVKEVSLKLNKRKRRKEVQAKDAHPEDTQSKDAHPKIVDTKHADTEDNEDITEMAVPVKFKAYPLETVSGKTKVPFLSGMVAMIVLVHKLVQKLKAPKEIGEIRIKMMALRKALKKPATNSSGSYTPNETIEEIESDEEHSESDKSLYGSRDEKSLQRKKAKKTDKESSDKEGKENPQEQKPNENYKYAESGDYESIGVVGGVADTSTEGTNTSFVSEAFSAGTNLATTTASTSAGTDKSGVMQKGGIVRVDFVDELILSVGAEDEGPLDYVTNTVTLYSEPRITTTMRALTLEEKFGIKYVCPGPQFEGENQMANVLFMSPERLRSSVTVFSVNSQKFNGQHDFWRMLIGPGSEGCKFDSLAFKYYRPATLYHAYHVRQDEFDGFSSFADHVYTQYHLNEWDILKVIWKHNDAIRKHGDVSQTIAVPAVLFKGDKLELNLGRWGDCDDMGFFMVTEALKPQYGRWRHCLPLEESVVADACKQIEVMIRQVRVRHDDLRLANMIFTKGRVHFIDFGMSYFLRKDLTDDRLDEIVREDQKILRELLL